MPEIARTFVPRFRREFAETSPSGRHREQRLFIAAGREQAQSARWTSFCRGLAACRVASWRMTSSWTEGAGTEAKAEVAMTSASSADAWTAREVGTEAKAEVAVATAVAVTSANSAAAAVWWRLAAAAAGAESGCTAACTGCARRLFTWRGVRRRRVLVHRDVHWLVREIGRD